jgi:hypothetical protein
MANYAPKQARALEARRLWQKYRNGGGRPDQEERDFLREAYWDGILPRDPDYNVSQWVEDGFPSFS